MVSPLPILGPRISTSHTEGIDPWLPVPAGKGDEPEDKREGDRSQRYSSSPVAGRLGKESLELGKCRDLLQGLLSGLTLALALEMQAGTTGQAWAIPSSSSSSPRVSRASGRVLLGSCGPHSASLGTSDASARQMGHVRLAFNHLSTHLVWNSWLQGRTRSSWRASKSLKQTTHSVCSD